MLRKMLAILLSLIEKGWTRRLQNGSIFSVPKIDVTKFLWGRFGASLRNFLAVGALAAMESAPMSLWYGKRTWWSACHLAFANEEDQKGWLEDGTRDGNGSVGHVSWVKWVTIFGWVTCVVGHCQWPIDPWWWNNCAVACTFLFLVDFKKLLSH